MNTELDRFSEIVGKIYEAGLSPERWPHALESICAELDADKAQMLYLDPREHMISFACGYGFDPYAHNIGAGRFRRYFASDPVALYGISHLNEVFSDRRVIDTKLLHASGMHRDIRQPADMEYMLTTFLTDKSLDWSGLCFFRRADQAAYNDDDEEMLNRLAPHIRRATYIHKTMTSAAHLNTVQNAVLDSLETGIMVVDEDHNIVIRNKSAHGAIERTGVMPLNNDRISCFKEHENKLLRQSIDAALAPDQDQPEKRRIAVRLSGPNPESSILAVITQLQMHELEVKQQELSMSKAHYTARIPTRKNVLITLCNPEDYKNRPVAMLSELFGLTPAEAALVDYLADDRTLEDAAQELGRSISTARVQLRSIFQKTDTNRQSSLIRLIMSIPE